MVSSLVFIGFIVGIFVGYRLFADSKARPFLRIKGCANCLPPKELAGLLASVVVQKKPRLIPNVIMETDKTVVFKHPWPKHNIHYIFVPKKDIKNIGELAGEDKAYIIDLFSTVGTVINQGRIEDYSLWTNGPGRQDVTYLHFHLGAE